MKFNIKKVFPTFHTETPSCEFIPKNSRAGNSQESLVKGQATAANNLSAPFSPGLPGPPTVLTLSKNVPHPAGSPAEHVIMSISSVT